jgi:hypothetical protein
LPAAYAGFIPHEGENSVNIVPDQADAQTAAERVLQRAKSHSIGLRRAFHLSLSRRRDTEDWERLESVAAGILEHDGRYRHAEWFTETDKRLKQCVASLFKNRTLKSSRAGHYLRAAKQVYESASPWSQELDARTMACWRHNALVWITLWHLADVPDVTATQAKECLDGCFQGNSPGLPPRKPRWSLSGAASSLAAAFRRT